MISKEKREAILRNFIRYQTNYCELKLSRYRETGQVSYLKEAIQISLASLNLPGLNLSGPPDTKSGLVTVLSKSLLDKYMVLREHSDLRDAISAAELAVAATPADSPDLPSCIRHLEDALSRADTTIGPSNYFEQGWLPALLAVQLHTMYKRNGVDALLREAIRLALVAVAETPEGHLDRPDRVTTLGHLLFTRFERFGELKDLREAILRAEESAAATPAGHPDRGANLNNLGLYLSTHFDRTGAWEDLQEGIRLFEEAVSVTPMGHPDRGGMLTNLGNQLATRFDRTGALEDLHEAIRRSEEAVAATPMDHPDYPGRLNNLAKHLSTRFDHTGVLEVEDMHEAVRLGEEAVASTPKDHPHHATMLTNLGKYLLAQFHRTRVFEDLKKAISLSKEAVDATPVGHPARARRLSNLGGYLRYLFDRTGVKEDLQDAICRGEEAVAAIPVDHPHHALALANLGNMLSARLDRTGALEDVHESIRLGEKAVAATPMDHPAYAGRLSSLGAHLSARFDWTRALEDIDEAIRHSKKAVNATPARHPNHALVLNNLGNQLSNRFIRTGALEDLQEAIRYSEQSVAATPKGHELRTDRLSNLGRSLSFRFERTGALEDLNEAIRQSEEAVDETPVGHSGRGRLLANLGSCLSIRFVRTGAREDLDEAIRRTEEAVNETPVDHPSRGMGLNNLGRHLSIRFSLTGKLEDLEEGIRRSEEAVAVTPVGHPIHAMVLNNLGAHLSTRFESTRDLEDLENGIRRIEEAVDATPVDHPDHARRLNHLGIRLYIRFDHSRNTEDRDRACIGWEISADSSTAHPVLRAKSAHLATLAHIKLERLEAAYKYSQRVIMLLHRAGSRAIEREDQEYMLGQVSGTSSLAASLALETGKPASTALGHLELGCGIIAGYTFDARNDVSELGTKYPALCSKYKALQDELLSPLQVPEMECTMMLSMTSVASRITRRLEAVRELDELEAEIRRKDGFSRFQLPPLSADFITLARSIGGPIVAFSVSTLRSDAIIVTQTEIKALSLPGLDYNTLQEKSGILSNGLMNGPKRTMPDRLNTLKRVLRWLWKVAVEPVLQELNFIQDVSKHHPEPLPRIWWISSGRMGMMPIHAAGDYASNPKIITSNYVISSYTPTIKSLAYARRKTSEVLVQSGNHVLIVGNSHGTSRTPSSRVLTEVHPEMKAIEKITKGAIGATCTVLHPPFKQAVLDNLSSCSIAHFSCHGDTDPGNPCNSHLLLPGPGGTEADPLRVKELSNRNLDRSMLAYLSACHTANYTSETLLDESIHIASGFQLAGFPHVVGTLWEANDLMAREVATEFYKNLFDSLDSGRGFADGIVAEALHKAVTSLRRDFDDNPILWAPFIHLGA